MIALENLAGGRFAGLRTANPELDFLRHDFLDPQRTGEIDWAGLGEQDQEDLKAYQRVSRLTQDAQLVEKLIQFGLLSAHHIGRVPESLFVAENRVRLGVDEEALRQLHRTALRTKIRAQMLGTAFKGTVGSPHFRASRMNNAQPDVAEYLQALPSYQDFFGSLDYCDCPHDQSILSPSAYLVDLLRVVFQAIDNSHLNPNIPDGWHFKQRRPDIENIPLTVEMTQEEVPYLQIVNDVLEESIVANTGWSDVFRSFASAPYPFSLPFILPLIQVRAYLDGLGASLLDVYQACRATPDSSAAAHLPTVLEIGREALTLSPTQSQVCRTRLTSASEIGAQYGISDGRILSLQATGTVSVSAQQNTVTGSATQFLSQVKAGDQVFVVDQRRTVVQVDSETQLTVKTPWSKAQSGKPMTVHPAADLGFSVEFNRVTGLTFEDLERLIEQDLDSREAAAGIPSQLFINQNQPAGQDLSIEVDESDPDRPVSRIKNQSLNTLDLLNRFVRLSRISGIGFVDLNWLIQAVGAGRISFDSLSAIGRTKLLSDTLTAALDETAALFTPIKTIGVGAAGAPRDLFDRLFNSPAVLGSPEGARPAFRARGSVSEQAGSHNVTGTGTLFTSQIEPGMRVRIEGAVRVVDAVASDTQLTVTAPFAAAAAGASMVVIPSPEVPSDALPVYHPLYAENPLYFDPVIEWDPDASASLSSPVRGRLRGALGLGDADLTRIGQQALSVLSGPNPPAGTTIPLSVPNLSLLYSYAKLAQLVRLPVETFLKLLSLVGINRFDTLDKAIAATDWAQWLRDSRLDIFALEYALTGQAGKRFTPSFKPSQLPNFLASTWVLASDWLIHPTDFVNQDIDETASQSYFEKLVDPAHAFLSVYGAVLDVPIAFAGVSFTDPVPQDAFVSALIDAPQSSQARQDLVSHQILDLSGNLSADYGPASDLSFLFPGDPQRVQMIAEVRAVLNAFQRRIQHVVDVLSTYGGAPTADAPNRGVQRFHLSEQLAVLLGSTTDAMLELGPYAADRLGLANYVAAFLRPPAGSPGQWGAPSPQIQEFMTLLSRLVTAGAELQLSAADFQLIVADPLPFGTTDFSNLDMQGVRGIWGFKQLERDFEDSEGRLASYFLTPASGDCGSDPKMQILSTVSGWPLAEICRLRAALFGSGDAYDTVDGLLRLQDCFQKGAILQLDMSGLLDMAALNALPAQVDDAAWNAYAAAATAAAGSFQARFGGPGWAQASRPVQDTLNEAKRDPLAGYALFKLQQRFPSIRNNDELYNYLLIDVEMSGCADISYIKQAILSVQLYMQRARLMVEPGVAKVQIPDIWWTWLGSYRTWEANRKVFLYPENFLDPGLRPDKTPQFQEAQDSLVSNDITAETVNETYVTYFESFTELAALKQVGAFYGDAPDPDAMGAIVPTLFVIARTPTAPYTYYLQRQVDNSLWTAFTKIDLSIPAPIVSPIYAFDRLMLFWVDQNTTAVSQISGGGADNSADTHALIKYSFVNFSGQWTQPQTLSAAVINFDPMQGGYKTDQIDPATFDIAEPQWTTVSPLLLKGQAHAPDSVLLNYGLFYDLPSGTPSPPAAPQRQHIPNPDAWALANTVFESSDYAVAASDQGITGSTFVNQGVFLDRGLHASPTYAIAGSVEMVIGSPTPYFPLIPRVVLPPGQVPTLRILQVENAFLLHYLAQGAKYTVLPPPPVDLLFNISDRAGYLASVVNQPFWFIFDNGDEAFLMRSTEPGIKRMEQILTLNPGSRTNQSNLISRAYTDTPQNFNSIVWSTTRLSTGAAMRLNQALVAGGVPQLLSPQTQVTPAQPLFPFSRFYQNGTHSPNLSPPALLSGDAIDYNGPYGLYFWEIFLNIPWLASNQLKANQRFEDAKTWLEYIFDPTIAEGADPTATNPVDRFWQLVAFRDFTLPSLREILTDPAQIAVYENHPFQPHAIARLRPSAFQKAIVMGYVDLLLEWGDYEFTKDTWESITSATLLYILAREILGPEPVDVGPCSTEPPSTFKDIRTKFGDDIPQFLIDMENAVPHMEPQGTRPATPDRFVPYNELDAYFCVPENEELAAYWDKVEDRLFKIRHCMNIQGVVRQLALFEPPIDPRALVRAAAAGPGAQVVDQLRSSAPPYRFITVLSLARDLTSQLIQVGGLLLSVLEKKDAEAMASLRASQETGILNRTTRTLELQIQEVEQTLAGMAISRQAALDRQAYYQGLVDEGLIPAEELQVATVILSNVLSTTGSVLKGLASGAHLVPNAGSPFAMTYGGREIGASVNSAAEVFDFLAHIARAVGEVSQIVAGFERRDQEWRFQAGQAASDVDQLDRQAAAANLQLQSLQRQLEVHLGSIANSIEIENFLKEKFTNAELYQWMIGRVSTVYGQAYRLALELSVSAQQAFQFELNSAEQFINFDYWNSSRKGLLAGEQLMLSLSQMEKAYYQSNSRRLEIEKTISLLSLAPQALLDLKGDGACSFSLTEYLFDLDYPGHYARQIRSIGITIPAVIGPHQNFKAMLTQLGNQILITTGAEGLQGVEFLLGQASETPDTSVLRSNWRANQKIALSTGVDDTGTFELNFNDDRYLPFEGTGAVSSWRLEMPKSSNLIDYDSISDVVIRLRYTALDGGPAFSSSVRQAVDAIPFIGQRAFNLAVDFPGQWFAFMHPAEGATEQSDQFEMLRTFFPPNLSLTHLTQIFAKAALAEGVSLGGALTAALEIGSGGTKVSETLTFDAATGIAQVSGLSISNWLDQPWKITVQSVGVPPGILDPATGLIDSRKLLSIGLLISYGAERAA